MKTLLISMFLIGCTQDITVPISQETTDAGGVSCTVSIVAENWTGKQPNGQSVSLCRNATKIQCGDEYSDQTPMIADPNESLIGLSCSSGIYQCQTNTSGYASVVCVLSYCAVEENGIDRLFSCDDGAYAVQVADYSFASCLTDKGVVGQTCYVGGKKGSVVVE